MYSSLLLSQGGGIVNEQKLSPRYPGSAALVIGLGGTGMRAVSKLKQKVYEQIKPDNPGQAVKRYDHIQFLVIDSDESEIPLTSGEGRIDAGSEFCSISDPTLVEKLGGSKATDSIKRNPVFNWFDIDRAGMAGTDGAGGVRQVGRYLFFNSFNRIKSSLESKMRRALLGQRPARLDIYVFAGISGGTGSGTFLDTCYLLRKIVSDGQITRDAKIFGMFFLPDVPMSKEEVATNFSAKKWNTSNGYAAMRELDHLMNLKRAGERFRQDYGNGVSVDTDEKPVDMCHLFSACNSEGVHVQDGFNVALNAAADLAMSYLCDTQLTNAPGQEPPQTIRGSLANIENGVTALAPMHGANLSYNIVGVSEACVPMSQFLTYLGCGLFREFSRRSGRDVNSPSKAEIAELATELGYGNAQSLRTSVEEGSPVLHLYNYADDSDALLASGVLGRESIEEAWRKPGQTWLEDCTGKRAGNASMLLCPLKDGYDLEKARGVVGSLVAKTFAKLCDIACDPLRGPYYAASLLCGSTYMLQSCLEDIKAESEHAASRCKELREGTDVSRGTFDDKVDANAAYCSSGFLKRKKCLAEYYSLVVKIVQSMNEESALLKTAEVAQALIAQLDAMYRDFFGPLADCFDELIATFENNAAWLDSPSAQRQVNGCIHLADLADVRDDLDRALGRLTDNECVKDLVKKLIGKPGSWQADNEADLKNLLCDYVSNSVVSFKGVVQNALDAYLAKKHLAPGQDPRVNQARLIQTIKGQLIKEMYDAALPMFWAQRIYNIKDSSVAFPYCTISVPASSNLLCEAVTGFNGGPNDKTQMQVRQTGLTDRISIIRYYSGVPLYAYQGVSSLKECYDADAAAMYGACAHLYSHTGRGGSYDRDWRGELPTPMPYSIDRDFIPQADAIEQLYRAGLEAGVIATARRNAAAGAPDDVCTISFSDKPDVECFVETACMGPNGKIDVPKWTTEYNRLNDMLDARRDRPTHQEELESGSVSTAYDDLRIDFFAHYRRYQDVVRDELAARELLQAKIDAYRTFKFECDRFDVDMTRFSRALFMGKFDCLDVQGRPNAYTNFMREVVLSYDDARGVRQKATLAKAGDTGPFGGHPLYRAFEAYRSLPADMEPCSSLDAEVDRHFAGYMRSGVDNRVAFTLQSYLTPTELGNIDAASAQNMTHAEHDALMQFYTRLMGEVSDFERQFTPEDWATGGVIAPGEAQVKAAGPAPTGSAANRPVRIAKSDDEWVCACGYANNAGKFCAGCGSPRPVAEPHDGWVCPACGSCNTGRFCPGCGMPRPVGGWTCPQCGTDNAGKFCSNCGTQQPAGDEAGI